MGNVLLKHKSTKAINEIDYNNDVHYSKYPNTDSIIYITIGFRTYRLYNNITSEQLEHILNIFTHKCDDVDNLTFDELNFIEIHKSMFTKNFCHTIDDGEILVHIDDVYKEKALSELDSRFVNSSCMHKIKIKK